MSEQAKAVFESKSGKVCRANGGEYVVGNTIDLCFEMVAALSAERAAREAAEAKLAEVTRERDAESAAMRAALTVLARYLRWREAATKSIDFKVELSEHAEDAEAALASDAGKQLLEQLEAIARERDSYKGAAEVEAGLGDEARQQVAELLNRIGHYEIMVADRDASLAAAEQHIERLKNVANTLEDFAEHGGRCDTYRPRPTGLEKHECTCGLWEAQTELTALTESEATNG